MARAVVLHEHGGPEVLRVEEVNPGPPGEGGERFGHVVRDPRD